MHQLGVYMKLLGSDFSNGVNFAIAKSMVRLEDMLGETTSCSSPDYEMWEWKSFRQMGSHKTSENSMKHGGGVWMKLT